MSQKPKIPPIPLCMKLVPLTWWVAGPTGRNSLTPNFPVLLIFLPVTVQCTSAVKSSSTQGGTKYPIRSTWPNLPVSYSILVPTVMGQVLSAFSWNRAWSSSRRRSSSALSFLSSTRLVRIFWSTDIGNPEEEM